MKQVVYVAGPMRGIPQYNFPAFDEARDRLNVAGYHAISPADLDRVFDGFDGTGEWSDGDLDLQRKVIRRDLLTILDSCNVIALLPGWQRSKGAMVELALARFLGLKVLCAVTLKELAV